MANGYYNLDVQTVNKAKQSAVAMAAYRSGDRLYSARDGLTKQYKPRPVEAENFILKPKHSPDWTLDREHLWNEVERYEARDNARIARSVLLSLPNDMTPEQQLDLAKTFVQANFVDEGMVADTSIHREDKNNPHAHVLLTVRPFDEHGHWEQRKSKRVPILDDAGKQTYDDKGWRKTRSIKLTDWDDKATLQRWRENWAEKLNEASLAYGLNKTYTHASFEAQGRLEKPEIRLTRKEYQFEARKQAEAEKNNQPYEPVTHYGKKKAAIQAENVQLQKIVHLATYKQEKDYRAQLDNLRSNLHVDSEKTTATQLLVARTKGYVDFQISKDLFHDFNSNLNKWKLKIERATSLNHAKLSLYNNIVKAHKDNPSIVERYGYSVDNFKEEMQLDIINLQKEEQKVNAENEKFNELKQATIVSYDYQKELLDLEFSSIYSDVDKNKFSYDEKYFAMQLLKDQNILLPQDTIKFEYVSQDKKDEFNKKYVPLWKQAQDTLTSLDIYERTIDKLERMHIDEVSPEELKETVINLNSIKNLQDDYRHYLEDISPMINNQIQEISDNEALNHSNVHIKVAFLDKYSTLSKTQKENINLNHFVEALKNEHEQQAEQFNHFGNKEQDEESKDISKVLANKSNEIASGLFDVLQSLSRTHGVSDDRKKTDRTKAFRKRGTDGREL